MGHAGRMIPIARKLQERQHNVLIGAGEEHQNLFRNELTGLTYIDFKGFKPSYSRYLPQYIIILLKIPLLLCHILAEHIKLKKIIRDFNIDIVISDNRAGLWNRKVKSVYITHQIVIPFPAKLRFLEWIGVLFHRFFIKKYTFCFIPDLPGETNLSGRLTHRQNIPQNIRFIGILSRFEEQLPIKSQKYPFPHNTLILSGPEPQRSILRQKVVHVLKDDATLLVILEGKPGNSFEAGRSGNIISYNHLPSEELQELISGSGHIVTRSGYTIIMELISLNCPALLIPTPGQTEQEYLAGYHSKKGWFTMLKQKNIEKEFYFPEIKPVWPSGIMKESRELLNRNLDELLDQ